MSQNEAMPVIGNVVHYVELDGTGECRAAIVTEVPGDETDERVGLVVFFPDGQWFMSEVPRDESWGDDGSKGFVAGSWHWSGRG